MHERWAIYQHVFFSSFLTIRNNACYPHRYAVPAWSAIAIIIRNINRLNQSINSHVRTICMQQFMNLCSRLFSLLVYIIFCVVVVRHCFPRTVASFPFIFVFFSSISPIVFIRCSEWWRWIDSFDWCDAKQWHNKKTNGPFTASMHSFLQWSHVVARGLGSSNMCALEKAMCSCHIYPQLGFPWLIFQIDAMRLTNWWIVKRQSYSRRENTIIKRSRV